MNRKKICLISSSGGHFEQLLMLKKLENFYEVFVVTEKTKYNKQDNKINYYLVQINRKEILFLVKMIINIFKSFFIFFKEKPDVIISTGALATIPMLFIGHIFKKKVIFFESFAKINSPTLTGKLIYNKNISDLFYVQWKEMKKIYPKSIFKGGIY